MKFRNQTRLIVCPEEQSRERRPPRKMMKYAVWVAGRLGLFCVAYLVL